VKLSLVTAVALRTGKIIKNDYKMVYYTLYLR